MDTGRATLSRLQCIVAFNRYGHFCVAEQSPRLQRGRKISDIDIGEGSRWPWAEQFRE